MCVCISPKANRFALNSGSDLSKKSIVTIPQLLDFLKTHFFRFQNDISIMHSIPTFYIPFKAISLLYNLSVFFLLFSKYQSLSMGGCLIHIWDFFNFQPITTEVLMNFLLPFRS